MTLESLNCKQIKILLSCTVLLFHCVLVVERIVSVKILKEKYISRMKGKK